MVIKLGDDDYERFLNDRREHDGTLIDPAYKFFLDHLREDGKSYVFEMINGNHGMPAFVKYEREDGLSRESKLDTQISSANISSEGRGDYVTKRRWTHRRSCSKSDQADGLSFVPNCQSECSSVDDSYRIFLSLLKFEGSSMSLEYEPEASVTYEAEKETSTVSESLTTESTKRSCPKSDQVSGSGVSFVPNSQPECSLVDESYRRFLRLLKFDGNSMSLEYKPGAPFTYEEEKETGVSVKYEEEKEISTGSESLATGSPRRSCLNSDHGVGISFVPDKQSECSLVDDSYQIFLSLLKFEGSSMRLEYKPGVYVTYEEQKETGVSVTYEEKETGGSVTYEEERETYTSSESLATESTVYSDEQILLPCISTQSSVLTAHEDDNSSMLPHDCHDSSELEFSKKLLVILDKPYDQDEYEKLLKDATDRKPLKRQKHLRSISKSYATKQQGLSYLDCHPDLAEEMESADYYNRLKLLRGLFFWLENLCHEGAFKPWLSPSMINETTAARY